MAVPSPSQPLGRSVLFGGLLAFLVLTTMISTISLTGQSLRFLIYLLMAGYGLGITGMAIVGFAVVRGGG